MIFPGRTISTDEADLLFYAGFYVDEFTSKKNQKTIFKNRSTGRMFIASKNASAERTLALQILQNGIWNKKIIAESIRAVFRFHYPDNKDGSRTARVMDLSNLYQGPEDALTKAGVIVDDKLIESHNGSCRIYGAPRKAIEIALFKRRPLHYSVPHDYLAP
jgi:Holliday junction resolvase RusA-like endonuclease